MPAITYEIKTASDLKAFREAEAALKRQIISTELAGESAKDLRNQLAAVSGAINKQWFVKRAELGSDLIIRKFAPSFIE